VNNVETTGSHYPFHDRIQGQVLIQWSVDHTCMWRCDTQIRAMISRWLLFRSIRGRVGIRTVNSGGVNLSLQWHSGQVVRPISRVFDEHRMPRWVGVWRAICLEVCSSHPFDGHWWLATGVIPFFRPSGMHEPGGWSVPSRGAKHHYDSLKEQCLAAFLSQFHLTENTAFLSGRLKTLELFYATYYKIHVLLNRTQQLAK